MSHSDLLLCQVIANVFFGGTLSSVFHTVLAVLIVTAATLVSLMIECLGILLELNVSTLNVLLPPFLKFSFLKYKRCFPFFFLKVSLPEV